MEAEILALHCNLWFFGGLYCDEKCRLGNIKVSIMSQKEGGVTFTVRTKLFMH